MILKLNAICRNYFKWYFTSFPEKGGNAISVNYTCMCSPVLMNIADHKPYYKFKKLYKTLSTQRAKSAYIDVIG